MVGVVVDGTVVVVEGEVVVGDGTVVVVVVDVVVDDESLFDELEDEEPLPAQVVSAAANAVSAD